MITRHLTLILALATLAATLAIAGCGGGGDSAKASLTKAQFAKQADLVCSTAGNEQAEKANLYLKKHPKAEEAEMIEPALIPPLEKGLEELKELGLPRDSEAQAEAFIEEFEKALEELKEDPEAALSPGGNPFEKANSIAKKYEYGDCGLNP